MFLPASCGKARQVNWSVSASSSLHLCIEESWNEGIGIQSEEIKRDPEMDKSAVWAGSGCMAVFSISGSRLISPPGTSF